MDTREKIQYAAFAIRSLLLSEFPEHENLKYQCKRASILFDLYAKENGINSYPTAGFITKKGDRNVPDRGHVWNVVYHDGKKYILDITLMQFESYLGEKLPKIVFLEEKEAMKTFHYVPDKKGKYEYRHGDVRLNLVEKLKNLT